MATFNKLGFRVPDGLPVDLVLFVLGKTELSVLLIQRGQNPHKGKYAFPGGFSEYGESLQESALRELKEETNVSGNFKLEQVGTYHYPGRDERGWIPSVVFATMIKEEDLHHLQALDDASDVQIVKLKEAMNVKLAFDHNQILNDSIKKIRHLALTTDFLSEYIPETFKAEELVNLLKVIVPTLEITVKDIETISKKKTVLENKENKYFFVKNKNYTIFK